MHICIYVYIHINAYHILGVAELPRLTFKFPTWRWESGEASLRASYLPQAIR